MGVVRSISILQNVTHTRFSVNLHKCMAEKPRTHVQVLIQVHLCISTPKSFLLLVKFFMV